MNAETRRKIDASLEQKLQQRQQKQFAIANKLADQLERHIEHGRYTVMDAKTLRISRWFAFRKSVYDAWEELETVMNERGWTISRRMPGVLNELPPTGYEHIYVRLEQSGEHSAGVVIYGQRVANKKTSDQRD